MLILVLLGGIEGGAASRQVTLHEGLGLVPIGKRNGLLIGKMDHLPTPGAAAALAPEAQHEHLIIERPVAIHTESVAQGACSSACRPRLNVVAAPDAFGE